MQKLTITDKLLLAAATLGMLLVIGSLINGYTSADPKQLSNTNTCTKQKLVSIKEPTKMDVARLANECKEEKKARKKNNESKES